MSGGVKFLLGGAVALGVGLILASWWGWGILGTVLKGGLALILFFAAIVLLLMGGIQFREEQGKEHQEEKEKRIQQDQQAVAR